MPLVRLLSLCLVVLALAAQPSRAALVCPVLAGHAQPSVADHDHATGAPHRHHQSCPGPMACCAPVAVQARAPALVSPPAWRPLLRTRPTVERDREDAALASLLRPPKPA